MRWLVIVALAACDSGAKPTAAPTPTVAPGDAKLVDAVLDAFDKDATIPFPRETLGWLEGTVGDAKTQERVGGGVVTPAISKGDWTPFAISDHETGLYRIRLPEGTYRVTFSYPGSDQERKAIVIKRDQSTKLDWAVPHKVVVTEQAAAARRDRDGASCPPSRGELASVADVPALAGAVLSYYAAHPNEMMDWEARLPHNGELLVVDDVPIEGGVVHLSAESMHGLAPNQFVFKKRAEIQEEANRSKALVGYLSFGAIQLIDTCARVHLGLTQMVPKARQDGVGTECCTSVEDLLQKNGTKWSMVSRQATIVY